MTIRNGIIALIFAVIVGVGGWYVFTHTQSLPHVLTEKGDRQIKEETEYYLVQALYPNTTRLGTRTDSSKQADGRAVATIEASIENMIADFKNEVKKALTADEQTRLKAQNTKYSLNIASHAYNSSDFVSYEFDIFKDVGGAHPMNSYKTFVFDLKGNRVELEDLFVSGSNYLERISAEVKKQVEAQLIAKAGAEAANSLVADGVAARAENFVNWVNNDGTLIILIPPYQVAAYAAGSFEARISLDDLKDILKPGIR
jgi:hypothetical protein